MHLSVRKSWEKLQTIWKTKASLWRNSSTGMPPKFFRTILCFVALIYNEYFFRASILRKLFDIRFSNKYCNFSHVCLLVKMAPKTVTRSIVRHFQSCVPTDDEYFLFFCCLQNNQDVSPISTHK